MDAAPQETAGTEDTDPVRRLLRIGPAVGFKPADWPDYPTVHGLGREHVPALTRLACDVALHRGDPDADDGDDDPTWAPIHALRALGQLGAVDAVAPVLAFLSTAGTDEWTIEEFPLVLGLIGPAAIPPIAAFLSGPLNTTSPAIGAMEGFKKIALGHPACRDDCVDLLTRILDRDADPDGAINGFAIWNLIDLAAVEAMDTIRAAFQRQSVDLSIVGDAEDVEIALGLRTRRATPRPDFRILPPGWLDEADAGDAAWDIDVPRHVVKIGRNEPCPCGSGKKYKKCCLP